MNRLNPKLLWQRLGELVVHYEKVLLALLSVIIVLSGTFWYRQFSHLQTDQPTAGGTYVEGIVGARDEMQAVAAKITKTGLFVIGSDGSLQNQLVSSWQANDTKDEYRFTLIDGVDAQAIQTDLSDNADAIDQATVELEGQVLVVRLPSANPDLPLLLTQPLFDYGPYKLSKITNETAILTRNSAAQAAPAYLNKIVLHAFPDENSLKDALAKHRVDGGYTQDQSFLPSNFTRQEFSEPLYYALILNVNRAPFRDPDYRHQVLSAQAGAKSSFSLTYPSEEPYHTLGDNLIKSWQNAGLTVTADIHPLEEIEQTIAPSRNFQAIITGVTYGSELDPYYLWDSSQIRPPGNNLSGAKDDRIDGIISQIRATYNVNERQNLIASLNTVVEEQGIAVILQQEKTSFLLSNHFRFVAPPIALSPLDHWQAIGLWSAK